jgi:hypothetical protein
MHPLPYLITTAFIIPRGGDPMHPASPMAAIAFYSLIIALVAVVLVWWVWLSAQLFPRATRFVMAGQLWWS